MLLLIVQDKEINLVGFPGTDLSPPPLPDLGTRLPCALSIGNSSLFFTAQFLMLAVCNNGGRWSESIYHVSDLNVYIGTQSGGRIERAFFMHMFFVLNNEQRSLHFANVQNSSSWIDAARKGFNRAL